MFPTDKIYFELLAYAKDQKQKKNILKFTNKSQYKVIQNIAKKIIEWRYSVKKYSISYFKKQKTFFKEIISRKNKNQRFTSGILYSVLHC